MAGTVIAKTFRLHTIKETSMKYKCRISALERNSIFSTGLNRNVWYLSVMTCCGGRGGTRDVINYNITHSRKWLVEVVKNLKVLSFDYTWQVTTSS